MYDNSLGYFIIYKNTGNLFLFKKSFKKLDDCKW